MTKPSAVIDKSLFHELCKYPDLSERERMWHELHSRHQVVVPMMLIEEAFVNAAAPEMRQLPEVERMVEQVFRHKTCWLDDLHEILFRELVTSTSLTTLPPVAESTAAEIHRLEFDAATWKQRVEERKQTARAIHMRWKYEQQRLRVIARTTELSNEADIFHVIQSQFREELMDEKRRQNMLEVILGETFRCRHPDAQDSIDRAFADFTPDTFVYYYRTLAFLLTRLAYVIAPVFTLPGPSPKMRRRFIKQNHNNLFDADYVTSALICNRLLTRDAEQARMCRLFQLGTFWKGMVVFIPPDYDIGAAIPSLLV